MPSPLLAVLRLNGLDLWRNKRAVIITLIALVVGFFALFLSLGLRQSQQNFVQTKARELLTGDVQISSTRAIQDHELKIFSEIFKPQATSAEVNIQASLRVGEKARLVELKAVSSQFPLIGRVLLEDNSIGDFSQLKAEEVWLADELREPLSLKLNDSVGIGSAQFRIAHWIKADVGFRRGASGFAPRTYILNSELKRTELIQPGSQVQYNQTFLLPANDLTLEQQKSQLVNWPDEIIVRTPQDAMSGIKRGLGYVENYLSLITLLLMLLGFISGFYLVQIHLRDRALSLALGLLFGAKPRWLEGGLILQIFILLFTSWLLAAGGTFGLFSLLNPSLVTLLPGGAGLVLGTKSILISFGILFLNTLIFSLPFALRFRRLEPDVLLNQAQPNLPMTRLREDLWPYGFALLGYSAIAAWLQQSWAVALAISLTIGVFVLFASLVLPYFALFRGQQLKVSGLARLSWLGIARPRLLTTLIWVSLSWSAALCAVIPNLLQQARLELKPPSSRELPQLFAINVRPEDVEKLSEAVHKEGAELRHASPLILARLRKINQETLREGPLSRFPMRLTFREKLSLAEKIVAGHELPPQFDGQGLPGLSVEIEFAKRNNMKIGDKVEFEISGLPLEAIVRNFREVKWNTFQPNFFMQFSGNVLEAYPKSYLAVIYGLPEDQVFAAQGRLSQSFPSLSLLNLATTIDRLSDIAGKLIWPIAVISIAGLLCILVLVGLLATHLWQERREERDVFHWLGATPLQIRKLFHRENLWHTGSALLFGAFVGLTASTVVIRQVFERWVWPQEFGIILLLIFLSLILSALPIWLSRQTRI